MDPFDLLREEWAKKIHSKILGMPGFDREIEVIWRWAALFRSRREILKTINAADNAPLALAA